MTPPAVEVERTPIPLDANDFCGTLCDGGDRIRRSRGYGRVVATQSSSIGSSDPAAWSHGIDALRVFIQLHGTADVPIRVRVNGVALGQWVQTCRTQYWSATLPQTRVDEVAMHAGWRWGPPPPNSWRALFRAFERYVADSGTTLVPPGTTVDGTCLAAWCNRQRSRYADGTLSPTQIELLNSISHWHWDADELRWRTGLSALRLHGRDHHMSSLRRGVRVDGIDLGAWIQRYRQDYRAGTLSSERIESLESLEGWHWGSSVDIWTDGVAALEAFIAENGHSSPAQKARANGYAVGIWVSERRREHRTGELDSDRARYLESLPGWQWAPRRAGAWERGMTVLTNYIESTGHSHPAKGEEFEGFPIGRWVSTQRGKHHKGLLSADRFAALDKLDGWRWGSPANAGVRTEHQPNSSSSTVAH